MHRRLVMGLAAVTFVAATAVATGPAAHAVQAAPRTSTSIYVQSSNTTTAYNQGCSAGHLDSQSPYQDSEVILDFGTQNSANTGNYLLTNVNTFISYAAVRTYAIYFADGYWTCTGADTTSVLTMAIGTNNSGSANASSYGATWANSVVASVKSSVGTDGYSGQVSVAGASDMESFGANNSSGTIAWVNGYSGTGQRHLVNFGSADGCPQTSYSNGGCAGGWDQYDVWYVSWGNPAAMALPEIYVNGQPQEWTMISRYGYYYQNGRKIYFDGPMTEYPSGYSSSTAWTTFWNDLNGSSSTAVNFTYRTNI